MKIIDEGAFIKLLPDEGMILTDVTTETMRSMEIDLGKNDSKDNYKDIPIDEEQEPTGELTVTDTLEMLGEMGVDVDE